MISSKLLKSLMPYMDIIEENKGKDFTTIIEQNIGWERVKSNKGAAGLIVENLLGLQNNSSKKADLEDLGVEIKVLPIYLDNLRVKEPTQIKMINYLKLISETWETTELRDKINRIFWIVYGVDRKGDKFHYDKYIILDYFIDVPDIIKQSVFQKDWEEIKSYVVEGRAEELSCSIGTYIEPKTKGKNNLDVTDAPDGKGGLIKVKRRAYYFKKNYTNNCIVSELDIPEYLLVKK